MGILNLEPSASKSFLDDLAACIRHALPRITDEEVLAILNTRGVALCGLSKEDLPDDLLEEVGSKEDLKEFQALSAACVPVMCLSVNVLQ
eukprot:1251659-Lingulodinium_polyedra.AAC.1